jgi:hypothetical protein
VSPVLAPQETAYQLVRRLGRVGAVKHFARTFGSGVGGLAFLRRLDRGEKGAGVDVRCSDAPLGVVAVTTPRADYMSSASVWMRAVGRPLALPMRLAVSPLLALTVIVAPSI